MSAPITPTGELRAEYPCGCFYLFEALSSGNALIQAWSHCAEHEARLQAFLRREHLGA